MIRVNLLPPEKRRRERTPLPRFMLILVTAATGAISVFAIVFVLLEIRTKKSSIEAKQREISDLREAVRTYDELERRQQLLSSKHAELSTVVGRKVKLWRVSSAVWEVLHENPKIWIDDFRVMDDQTATTEMKKRDKDARQMPEYGLSMRAHVASHEVDEMTRFRDGLKKHPVLVKDLPDLNIDAQWKVEEKGEATQGRTSLVFTIKILGPSTPPGPPPRAQTAPSPRGLP